MLAASRGYRDIVEVLIGAGADVRLHDDNVIELVWTILTLQGQNAMCYAHIGHHEDVIEMLRAADGPLTVE